MRGAIAYKHPFIQRSDAFSMVSSIGIYQAGPQQSLPETTPHGQKLLRLGSELFFGGTIDCENLQAIF